MKQNIKKSRVISITELSTEKLLTINGGHNPWADTDENNPWIEGEG